MVKMWDFFLELPFCPEINGFQITVFVVAIW